MSDDPRVAEDVRHGDPDGRVGREHAPNQAPSLGGDEGPGSAGEVRVRSNDRVKDSVVVLAPEGEHSWAAHGCIRREGEGGGQGRRVEGRGSGEKGKNRSGGRRNESMQWLVEHPKCHN